jgi:hypothetical protein
VARDLRLRLEAQPGGANNTVNASAPIAERETPVLTASHRASRQAKRLVKATGGMFLFILVFVILASVIDPQTFSGTTVRILAAVKRNLNQWALLANQQPAPQKANTKAEHVELKTVELKNDADLEDKAHRIILPYGSTIYQIATEEYGANAVLGMDLIKEFNPEITNLNWVSAGQQLVLPSLTRETLLRRQLDGSYRVIVGSFLSQTGADEFSRRIAKLGHRAVITSIRVSNDLVLHRLEIDDLKTFEEAFRILETGLKSQWLTLADQSGTSELGQGNTY